MNNIVKVRGGRPEYSAKRDGEISVGSGASARYASAGVGII
jgi:hypothetical protein